ncbi:E3 ubiquitin-protein ligase UPL5-like [Apium graveolens]|uniref:E3 ubiquitin-protein ligase UPL5-like n=1 Tax=Apium graveolens TaxID=4045 RepID=UPI003D7AEF50
MHKVHIGIVLDRVFYLQLANRPVSLEDIQDIDPFVYNSCKDILNMDPEMVDQDTLALTFSVDEIDESGSKRVLDLVHGGANIAVDSNNRGKYVDLLIQHWFVKSVAIHVDEFIKGFNDIISSSEKGKVFFKWLESEDLDKMLHGSERPISVEDWKDHTTYYGYNDTDNQIVWFWEIVERMSEEQRKELLFFWT